MYTDVWQYVCTCKKCQYVCIIYWYMLVYDGIRMYMDSIFIRSQLETWARTATVIGNPQQGLFGWTRLNSGEKRCEHPLVMTNIAIENHHWNSEFSHWNMVIFHSYVSLPEDPEGRTGVTGLTDWNLINLISGDFLVWNHVTAFLLCQVNFDRA